MPSDSVPGAVGGTQAGTTHVLELHGIAKRYGSVVAISPLDLNVIRGEFLTILGPSGCGKTTLLRLIAGFIVPTGGQIILNGVDVARSAPAERGIGMVFQHYALFPHMTVSANIAYGLNMRRWPKRAREARVTEMLDLVGLEGLGGRLPRELSGGQQQRVALARALAFGPSLLLMDEPLGALDRDLRERMASEIRRIHHELRTTVIYVTHDRDEALTLADRIALMRTGVIEALDQPRQLFMRPSSPFVASFFGGYNLVPVRVLRIGAAGAQVECLGTSLEVLTGGPIEVGDAAWLAVPPRAIHVKAVHDGSLSVEGKIAASSYQGDVIRVTCSLPGDLQVLASIPTEEASQLIVDQAVRIYVDIRKSIVVADRRALTAGAP